MSTSDSPSRDQLPADPNRSWAHQPGAPNPSQPPPPNPDSQNQPQQPPTSQKPGGAPRPTITDAIQTIKPADFLTFHQAPCARTGLLTGIGAGAAMGALRWVMGLAIPRAANWAVGTGALAAVGQYEYCQFRRRQERDKMKRVVEVYAAKTARERREKEAEERRRREEEEAARRREEEERRRRWWRFW
ncbi:hypothetical protein VTK26DRAFT_5726 [Humicola hyalothermophila]